MPHSVKIDDKLYDKLKMYCDLNNTSPHILAKDAIEKYLNDEMYGDAPFLQPHKVKEEPVTHEEVAIEEKKTGIVAEPTPVEKPEEKVTESLTNNIDEAPKPRKRRL